MEIYDHPTFRMACRQFDLVADHLQIPEPERDRIKYPKRALAVALPIHCDDGTVRVMGYYPPKTRPRKNIVFVSRGEGGELRPGEHLE